MLWRSSRVRQRPPLFSDFRGGNAVRTLRVFRVRTPAGARAGEGFFACGAQRGFLDANSSIGVIARLRRVPARERGPGRGGGRDRRSRVPLRGARSSPSAARRARFRDAAFAGAMLFRPGARMSEGLAAVSLTGGSPRRWLGRHRTSAGTFAGSRRGTLSRRSPPPLPSARASLVSPVPPSSPSAVPTSVAFQTLLSAEQNGKQVTKSDQTHQLRQLLW